MSEFDGMKGAYRLALACGALPLLTGIAIFVLWLVTGWDWLMLAGAFTLYGGLAIILIGTIFLARFCWLSFRTTERSPRRFWIATLGCAVLLLSNFPVAGGIIVAAIAVETRYIVVVQNASPQPLDDVRVLGGGCEAEFGAIPPGGVLQRSFWIQCDGQLEVRATSGSTARGKVIDGYVTHNMGRHTRVVIDSDSISSSALASWQNSERTELN